MIQNEGEKATVEEKGMPNFPTTAETKVAARNGSVRLPLGL